MRGIIIGAILGFLLVAALSFRSQARKNMEPAEENRRSDARADVGGDDTEASWIVSGTWFREPQEALQDALKKAQVKVDAYFHKIQPGRLWSPSAYYISHYLTRNLEEDQGFDDLQKKLRDDAKKIGSLTPNKDQGYQILEEKYNFKNADEKEALVGPMQRVWIRVAVSQADLKDFQIQDRRYRLVEEKRERESIVEERMLLGGKILGSLVALLAVVAGYIRLDEVTKGFYTGWLRLAAAGLVAVVGVGLWLR